MHLLKGLSIVFFTSKVQHILPFKAKFSTDQCVVHLKVSSLQNYILGQRYKFRTHELWKL